MKKHEGAQFLQWFGPILEALRTLGGSGTPEEAADTIAATLKIPDDQLNDTLPSGGSRHRIQAAFARLYLAFEGLLDSSQRGVWSLTEKGRASTLSVADAKAIFQKWVKIHTASRKERKAQEQAIEEQGLEGPEAPSADYRARLLDLLRALPSPEGFERLSQRLLRESGFSQVTVSPRIDRWRQAHRHVSATRTWTLTNHHVPG